MLVLPGPGKASPLSGPNQSCSCKTQVAESWLTLGRLLAYHACVAAVITGLYTGYRVSKLKMGHVSPAPRQLKTLATKAVCQ